MNAWRQVGFLLLTILAAVTVIDAASSWVGRRMLHRRRRKRPRD